MRGRYVGTVGGLVWAWAQPILNVAAYFVVFDLVLSMRVGGHAPIDRVGAFLVVGLLPWTAFSDATQRAMLSLTEAGPMLQKNPMLPALFPARSVLASALVYAPLLLALLLVYAPVYRGAPATWLGVPLLVAVQALLGLLLGYALAVLTAALRDVAQVVGFLFSVGAFAAPILFPVTMFPAGWRWLLWLNPMTPIVLAYQSLLLQGQWPPSEVWLAMALWLAALAALLELLLRRSHDELVGWL